MEVFRISGEIYIFAENFFLAESNPIPRMQHPVSFRQIGVIESSPLCVICLFCANIQKKVELHSIVDLIKENAGRDVVSNVSTIHKF